MVKVEEYWANTGLDEIITPYLRTKSWSEDSDDLALQPNINDLAHIHRTIRERMCTTVLEFGVGFSSLVIADALAKNEEDFISLPERPKLRVTTPFELHSIDTSEYWIGQTRQRFPHDLLARSHFYHSDVHIGTHNGQLCHFYERLPNVVPDFVYLDGPAPKDVRGSVNGLDFSMEERTVMAADLLLMESTFLPGTFILVDGRTNNARFLARNFTRPFRVHHDTLADITTFELDEPPLGRQNSDLAALRKVHQNQWKDIPGNDD